MALVIDANKGFASDVVNMEKHILLPRVDKEVEDVMQDYPFNVWAIWGRPTLSTKVPEMWGPWNKTKYLPQRILLKSCQLA